MVLNNKPQGGAMYLTQSRFLNSTAHWHATLLVAIAILPFTIPAAHAGQYVLEKGKGVEVCEAYQKNLNSLKPRQPFRCDRPVNPEFKDFVKPVFQGPESLSPDRAIPGVVIKKVERFLWDRDANPIYYFPADWSTWRGTREQYEKAWQKYNYGRERYYMDRWMIAKIDIDNDGTPETVYRDGQCPAGALLLVLNKEVTDIDHAKTKLVMPHPERKAQGLGELRPLIGRENADWNPQKKLGRTAVEDSLSHAGYDIFQFKDKTYFDLWWSSHPNYKGELDFLAGGPLHVYIIENKQTREVCTYKYQHTD